MDSSIESRLEGAVVSTVYTQQGEDREGFVRRIFQEFEIRRKVCGKNILVKPNIVSHEPYPTTTHPVVVETLGYNSIWFGILCTKLIEIGCITPPVGLNVFVIGGIARDVPMQDIFQGALWFVLFEAVTIAILFLFPILSYWLPDTMPGVY